MSEEAQKSKAKWLDVWLPVSIPEDEVDVLTCQSDVRGARVRKGCEDEGCEPPGVAKLVDPAKHPYVVMSAAQWNDFQRVMDETGTREKFRECDCVAMLPGTKRMVITDTSGNVVGPAHALLSGRIHVSAPEICDLIEWRASAVLDFSDDDEYYSKVIHDLNNAERENIPETMREAWDLWREMGKDETRDWQYELVEATLSD